mgnify:CR=1 FL=1
MNTSYWLMCAIAVLLLALFAGVKQAPAKTVSVCVSVKLPTPGKCSYLTVRGYKVRVCR